MPTVFGSNRPAEQEVLQISGPPVPVVSTQVESTQGHPSDREDCHQFLQDYLLHPHHKPVVMYQHSKG